MWEAGIGSCALVTISAIKKTCRRFIRRSAGIACALIVVAELAAFVPAAQCQNANPSTKAATETTLPPRVAQARSFLAKRSWPRAQSAAIPGRSRIALAAPKASFSSSASATNWQPLGPSAVISSSFGLVTGRVSSIAIDPSDPTGNRVFVGTTGGGVWLSQNAGTSGSVVFNPLTDAPAGFDAVRYASISIGAVSVQPGGTGVVLAGTGDPNDALDSYYGAGILRSPDGGNTWTVMSHTADQTFSFQGEGFAGFAWSYRQSAIGCGRRLLRPTKEPWSVPNSTASATRASTTPPTRAPPGPSRPSPTHPAMTCKGRWISSLPPTETRPPLSSGIPSASCSSPQFVFTATTSQAMASSGPA